MYVHMHNVECKERPT